MKLKLIDTGVYCPPGSGLMNAMQEALSDVAASLPMDMNVSVKDITPEKPQLDLATLNKSKL